MEYRKRRSTIPPTKCSVPTTVRIDAEYHQKIVELARFSRRSRNELINMAIKFALDNTEFVDQKAKFQL